VVQCPAPQPEHETGAQEALVEQVHCTGWSEAGTEGVSVTTLPVAHDETAMVFIVTMIVPATTDTESAYLPTAGPMSAGTRPRRR